VTWYRSALSEPRWALAGQESPTASSVELLFVRPDELGRPHEERSAWVRVALRRTWPYQYVVELRRDPSGIHPPP
jgi:hypothetical protein